MACTPAPEGPTRWTLGLLANLNNHKPASLYQAFEPKEARRIREGLEFHYTPKLDRRGGCVGCG